MADMLLLGTRKGTVIVDRAGGVWRPRPIAHEGIPVCYAARDPRDGMLWASLDHGHWGPKLSRSRDSGATWEDMASVKYPAGARYIKKYLPTPDFDPEAPAGAPEYGDATVYKIWHIAFGSPPTPIAATGSGPAAPARPAVPLPAGDGARRPRLPRQLDPQRPAPAGARFGLDFYHLRMATPQRRALRRAQYATLDPARATSKLGYDDLDDDRGKLVLRPIPESRRFSPPHVEDHGLWASTAITPNPPIWRPIRWPRGSTCWSKPAAAAASRRRWRRRSTCTKTPPTTRKSPFWPPIAPSAPATGNRRPDRRPGRRQRPRGADGPADPGPRAPRPWRQVRGRRRPAPGRGAGARQRLLRPRTRPDAAPPTAWPNRHALWRRWVTGPAAIDEGVRIAHSDLAVVVLAMGAPAELETAVASLCAQSVVPEIVVVNSRGGDARARLAAFADRVRIIDLEDRLYPGAARNIGIDASAGRFVAFLASDCAATPGSIEAPRPAPPGRPRRLGLCPAPGRRLAQPAGRLDDPALHPPPEFRAGRRQEIQPLLRPRPVRADRLFPHRVAGR